MKRLKWYIYFLVELLILSGCLDFGVGFGIKEDINDLYQEMIEDPENQYELTDSVAYTVERFYYRISANGDAFQWFSYSYGTAGGLSSPAGGGVDTTIVEDSIEMPKAILVTTDSLMAIYGERYSISPCIMMDDGSVCYTVFYRSDDWGYEEESTIYNSQLGRIYHLRSYSDGAMDGSHSHGALMGCSFSAISVGKLLNEYYAKRNLPREPL